MYVKRTTQEWRTHGPCFVITHFITSFWGYLGWAACNSIQSPSWAHQPAASLGFSRSPGITSPQMCAGPRFSHSQWDQLFGGVIGMGLEIKLLSSQMTAGLRPPHGNLRARPSGGPRKGEMWSFDPEQVRRAEASERERECRQQPLQSVNPWEERRECIQGKPTWDFGGQGRS